MAANKVGGGAVVITADTGRMERGLDRARQRVEKFGKDTNNLWGKLGERFGGGGAEFLTKSLGAGFFGGIAGSIAIRTMNFVTQGLSDVWSEQSKWTQELGRTTFQLRLLETEANQVLKIRDEWLSVATSGERVGLLGFESEQARIQQEASLAETERLRRRLETLNSFGVTNTLLALSGGLDREKAFAERDLGEAEKSAAKFTDRLADLAETKRRLDPLFDPAVKSSLNAYISDLSQKLQTLGLSADEARLRMLELRGGPSALIESARRSLSEFKAAEESAELRKSATELADQFERQHAELQGAWKSAERLKLMEIETRDVRGEHTKELERARKNLDQLELARKNVPALEYAKALEMERISMGLTAEQARLLTLAVEGANRSTLEAAATQVALLDQARAAAVDLETKFGPAILSGSQEAYSLELRHRYRDSGGDPNKGKNLFDVVEAQKEATRILSKIDGKLSERKLGVIP